MCSACSGDYCGGFEDSDLPCAPVAESTDAAAGAIFVSDAGILVHLGGVLIERAAFPAAWAVSMDSTRLNRGN